MIPVISSFLLSIISATAYNFLSEKLRNDEKKFKSKLKKDILCICVEASDSLRASPEFKNIIPDKFGEAISDAIIELLGFDTYPQRSEIEDMLNRNWSENIPRHLLKTLLDKIEHALRSTLANCQQNYNLWLMQEFALFRDENSHEHREINKKLDVVLD